MGDKDKKEIAECVSKKDIEELTAIFKVLSDNNRLKIICLLFQGEKCVCDVEEQLRISQPLASHHLHVLKEAGLVEARREGTWSYYRLVPESIHWLNHIFKEILGTQKLQEIYSERAQC